MRYLCTRFREVLLVCLLVRGEGYREEKKVYFFYKKLARTKKMFTFAARFNGIGFRPAEEGMILRGGMLTGASDCPIFFWREKHKPGPAVPRGEWQAPFFDTLAPRRKKVRNLYIYTRFVPSRGGRRAVRPLRKNLKKHITTTKSLILAQDER